MVSINLVVLYCSNLEQSLSFYQALGLDFKEEQHENRPVYYSCLIGGILLDLCPLIEDPYPLVKDSTVIKRIPKDRIGLVVDNLDDILHKLGANVLSTKKDKIFGLRAILEDPDGRSIFLSESK